MQYRGRTFQVADGQQMHAKALRQKSIFRIPRRGRRAEVNSRMNKAEEARKQVQRATGDAG